MSAKTVEHHLRSVFRKLGIKRRAELARLMRSGAARRCGRGRSERGDHLGRPGHGVVVGLAERGEVVVLGDRREVPALVRERGAEDAALGAGVVEQCGGQPVVERQAFEQLRQRAVQERVGDREQADGEAAVVLGLRRGGGQLLAQARAHERGHEQLVRLPVAAGEHQQHRPAADGAAAE